MIAREDELRIPELACVLAVLRIRDFDTFRLLRDQSIAYDQLRKRADWLFRRTESSALILGDLIVGLEYCLASPMEFATWDETRKARFGRHLRQYDVDRENIVPHLCAMLEMFQAD